MSEDSNNKRTSLIAISRIVEERAKQDPEYRRTLAQSGKTLLSQVRTLTEAELLGKLERVGIVLDRSSYAEIAEHALSAEEILKMAITDEVRSRFESPFDEDWVWFALVILWERWFPQWLNLEQLDDRIQAGYVVSKTSSSAACDQ